MIQTRGLVLIVLVSFAGRIAGQTSTVIQSATRTGPDAFTPAPDALAYVANAGGGSISAYTVYGGIPYPAAGSPFADPACAGQSNGSCPVWVTADPLGRFLYVTESAAGMVSAFSIDPISGALTPAQGSPYLVGGIPQSVAVHPTGKFVYVTNIDSGNISAFNVNAKDGSLSVISQSPFLTASGSAVATFDPAGRFLFVGNSNGLLFVFTISATTGVLTPVSGSPYPGGNRAAVHPNGLFVYTGGCCGGSGVAQGTGYSIDQSTGALTSLAGTTFNMVSGLEIDPTGRFLYTAVGALTPADGLYGYTINTTTGALSAMPGAPFSAGATPQWTALDPTGQFLYVVNTSPLSWNVSGYAIDPVAGGLTPISGSPFANGFAPQGITTVTQNEGLTFPVRYSVSQCKGGTCTPNTVNISAVFDHKQTTPYGSSRSIEDYLGEVGACTSTQLRSPIQHSWGYQQSSGLPFTVNGNYYTGGKSPSSTVLCSSSKSGPKTASNLFLYYTGHPGYDYPFPALTPVYPAISGCITYKLSASGGSSVNQANYHVLSIIPYSAEPPNGCPAVTGSHTGYIVFYLHLASYIATDGTGNILYCKSPPTTKNPSATCPDPTACPTCPKEGKWVSVSRPASQPIAYVGDFSQGLWGGVGFHLHFEVDQMPSLTATPIPLDPYGWQSSSCPNAAQCDPYSPSHSGVINTWLWRNYNSDGY